MPQQCAKSVPNVCPEDAKRWAHCWLTFGSLLAHVCAESVANVCQTCVKTNANNLSNRVNIYQSSAKPVPTLCQTCINICVKLCKNVISLCQHVSNVCQNLPKTCVNICVNLCQHVPNLCQNLCKHVTTGWLFRSAPKRCPRVPERLPKGLKQV